MTGPRVTIEEELEERVRYFKSEDKLLEAQRIAERTNFDIEMLQGDGILLRHRKLFPPSGGTERRGSRPIR